MKTPPHPGEKRENSMTATQRAAHRHATAKAAAYRAKFKRPVQASAVDGVYVTAYVLFLRRASAA